MESIVKDSIPKSSGNTRRMRASVIVEHNNALALKELPRKTDVLAHDIIEVTAIDMDETKSI